jgi:DNA-binding transcriptional MerR regulator
MLKIGDFARISGISIKALRYYDDIGILTPAHTDAFTGYRYYGLEQIARSERIAALKAMGLSLEQVGLMLEQRLSDDDVRALLREKRRDLFAQMGKIETQIREIDCHLELMEQESRLMNEYIVTLRKFDPIGDALPILPQLRGDKPFEIQLPPMGGTLERDVLFKIEDMPTPQAVAVIVHHGHPLQLGTAYRALDAWLTANGYRPAAPPREVRVDDETVEIHMGVMKVSP